MQIQINYKKIKKLKLFLSKISSESNNRDCSKANETLSPKDAYLKLSDYLINASKKRQ